MDICYVLPPCGRICYRDRREGDVDIMDIDFDRS